MRTVAVLFVLCLPPALVAADDKDAKPISPAEAASLPSTSPPSIFPLLGASQNSPAARMFNTRSCQRNHCGPLGQIGNALLLATRRP